MARNTLNKYTKRYVIKNSCLKLPFTCFTQNITLPCLNVGAGSWDQDCRPLTKTCNQKLKINF